MLEARPGAIGHARPPPFLPVADLVPLVEIAKRMRGHNKAVLLVDELGAAAQREEAHLAERLPLDELRLKVGWNGAWAPSAEPLQAGARVAVALLVVEQDGLADGSLFHADGAAHLGVGGAGLAEVGQRAVAPADQVQYLRFAQPAAANAFSYARDLVLRGALRGHQLARWGAHHNSGW